MARRKRKGALSRLIVALGLLAIIVGVGRFGYQHANRWLQRSLGDKAAPPQNAQPVSNDSPRRIEGTLAASGPVRDGQLGVSANAAVLLRHVEMYQWQEHCENDACRYDQAWSARVDSHKFREPKGHENPAAPFNDSMFFAPDLKLAGYAVDPDLLVAQLHVSAYAARDANLPPNLAASFAERDGVLYAGGDPARPAIGEVRVSYRIIATGSATLNGVLRAGKLVGH